MKYIEYKNIEYTKAVYAIFNSGKLDELDKYFDQSFVEHQTNPGQKPGLAGLKDVMQAMHTAFPDFKMITEDIFASGDKIGVRSTISAANTGRFMGPPNGEHFKAEDFDINRFSNGEAFEHWGLSDGMEMIGSSG